jgi:fibronectin type 3 domain-containing protein
MPLQTKRTNSFRLLLAACALLCIGLAGCHKAPPHSVTLTWEASPAAPGVSVAGYNVYRSTTAAGPFVKLASRVPGPPYEDRLVVSGRTYFYVVTAVDRSGRESVYSDKARAYIP